MRYGRPERWMLHKIIISDKIKIIIHEKKRNDYSYLYVW